jgi:hypothetical protein
MMKEPNSSSTKNRPLIRASELAHFGFCERAWWLASIKKVPAANLADRQRGQRGHDHHARQVHTARRRRQVGLLLLGGGALLFLIVVGVWLW